MEICIGTTPGGLFEKMHNGFRGVVIFNAAKICNETLTSTTENKRLAPREACETD